MEPMGSDVELRIFWGGGDGLGIFKIRPPPPGRDRLSIEHR